MSVKTIVLSLLGIAAVHEIRNARVHEARNASQVAMAEHRLSVRRVRRETARVMADLNIPEQEAALRQSQEDFGQVLQELARKVERPQ